MYFVLKETLPLMEQITIIGGIQLHFFFKKMCSLYLHHQIEMREKGQLFFGVAVLYKSDGFQLIETNSLAI